MNELVHAAAPELAPKRSHHGQVILLIGLSQLIVTTDFSIIGVALPSVGSDFKVPVDILSWVVAATSLALGAFLIPSGRAADLFGPRRCILLGAALFAVASIDCALAPKIGWLIAGRALLGLGAAILAPASLSLTHTLLPAGEVRNRALKTLGTMQGLSLAIGLLVGGIMTSALGWRSVFLVNLLPIVLIFALASRVVPPTATAPGKRQLDLVGTLLVAAGPAAFLLSISILSRHGWDYVPGLLLLLASLITAAFFFWVEARVAAPLLPPQLFRYQNVLGGNLATLLSMAAIGAMFVLMSLLVQQQHGFTALIGGLAMMPYAIAVGAGANVVSFTMARLTFKGSAVFGNLVQLLALGLLALFGSDQSYAVGLLPGLLLGGFGNIVAFITLMAVATETVPGEEQGVASGALLAAQQLGIAIGVAIASIALSAFGYRAGFIAGGAFSVSSLLMVVMLTQVIRKHRVESAVPSPLREAVYEPPS